MVNTALGEKLPQDSKELPPQHDAVHDIEHGQVQSTELKRNLQGRHMQMIAIGTVVLE
jgi:amino acid permease